MNYCFLVSLGTYEYYLRWRPLHCLHLQSLRLIRKNFFLSILLLQHDVNLQPSSYLLLHQEEGLSLLKTAPFLVDGLHSCNFCLHGDSQTFGTTPDLPQSLQMKYILMGRGIAIQSSLLIFANAVDVYKMVLFLDFVRGNYYLVYTLFPSFLFM